MTIDLVISYYKEDLGWLDKYKNKGINNIYIYNKGPNDIPDIKHPYIGIKMDNIGRCDHTYLYHIIHKYDVLADVTIFTTGSVDLPNKTEQFDFIFNRTLATHDSVFHGYHYNDTVQAELYNFNISAYNSSDPKNNDRPQPMALSTIRPFGAWYESHFKNINIHFVNFSGVFSVSKKHIHHHDVVYYQNLITDFPNNSNPEVGHYFERAWVAIFHPIPKECLNYKLGFTHPIPEERFNYTFWFFLYSIIVLLVIVCIFALYKFDIIKKTYIMRYIAKYFTTKYRT